MGVIGRTVCKLRGHTWEEHSDPVGTLTFCVRCGAVRHAPSAEKAPKFDYTGPVGGGDT